MARRCRRCRLFAEIGVDGQAFYCGKLQYSVTKARAIVEAVPRKPIVVRPDLAVEALGNIHLKHVAHVDMKYPAIAVRERGKLVFIDGNHRVAAWLCKRKPIKAYLLTARERRVILSSK